MRKNTTSLLFAIALIASQFTAHADEYTWDVPEEEKNEALGTNRFSSRSKQQVKLDPLQICLYPTYLTLPEEVLQLDLRDSIQDVVSETLATEYSDSFVYFAVTADASIDWYSGEDSQPACGSLAHRLPSSTFPASAKRLGSMKESAPCTCALYNGAVVLLQADGNEPLVSEVVLEPLIASVLSRGLVWTLRNKTEDELGEPQDPFYTEIKGASVSWSAAERKPGGKLYVTPSVSQETVLQDVTPLTEPPVDKVTEDSEGTFIDVVNVNSLQEQEGQSSAAGAFQTKRGKIFAGVLGAFLLLVLIAIFWSLCLARSDDEDEDIEDSENDSDDPRAIKETTTVMSTEDYQDQADEEVAHPRRFTRESTTASSSVEEDCEDASAAAQYVHASSRRSSREGNNVLDSVSVGSEWTVTTGVTTALGLTSTSSKTTAEMQAAKETFDRDRQITLQKDMLQSEWTSGGGVAAQAAMAGPGLLAAQAAAGDGCGSALQFQDATGQGEEIFLMQEPQPSPRR